ncbi:hypothetical protein A374_16188 [Fictibacillus macauensis ZFHKF-1]|uniref:Uncharacterized protein n=1 Tax=Fictibacillus macauensis ZFHKF-1 TaxID=1196324 RepID=I8AFD1_9BACL|nr:hypothetical protein [Fictibacillus macauensis]EIT84342.1 hypothetical protein A374_16188 [Fictibacillus macauensis ZFHKF-1]
MKNLGKLFGLGLIVVAIYMTFFTTFSVELTDYITLIQIVIVLGGWLLGYFRLVNKDKLKTIFIMEFYVYLTVLFFVKDASIFFTVMYIICTIFIVFFIGITLITSRGSQEYSKR